ncbi:uncharacterized protein LOC108117060 isoform X2 [Drosophila eugracilis]|nr:uncharacterized protein LOC108117060 isoform X2 [Drosophila eugracilis]
MMMILLNVCLFACPFLLYLYFNTMNAENRHQVLDFVIVVGGILAIMLLCRLGDLSKGRPNFYYI